MENTFSRTNFVNLEGGIFRVSCVSPFTTQIEQLWITQTYAASKAAREKLLAVAANSFIDTKGKNNFSRHC